MKKKEATLFGHTGQSDGIVVLNWNDKAEQELIYFAEAFHLTAKEAVTALRQNKYFGPDGIPLEDFRAYPIVFLYRHAIELYLKAALRVGSPMLGIKEQAPVDPKRLNAHNLIALTEDWERMFEAYGWKWDPDTPGFPTIESFRQVIQDFDDVDSGSYAFRYPLDKAGQPSLKPRLTFDVFAVAETLDSLLHVLRNAALGFYEELQDMYQEMSDRHQHEMDGARDSEDYKPDRRGD